MKFVSKTLRYVTDDHSMWSFSFETMDSKDKRQLRKIITDPDGLDSSEEIPLVDATPASVGGYSLYETETTDIGNGHVRNLAKFSQRGSRKTQMMNDGSEGSIGIYPADGYKREIRYVACLASEDTDTIANTYGLPLIGTTSTLYNLPFRYLRWKRYHATMMAYTVYYAAPTGSTRQSNGAKVQVTGGFSPIFVKKWFGFNGSNVPCLSVASCLSRGSGKFLVQLGQFDVVGVGGPITVKQQFEGTVPPLHLDLLLNTNSSPFLGSYPEGSVQYLAANYDILIQGSGGGSSTYNMTYQFNFFSTADWVGFPALFGIPPGGMIHTTSSVSVGLLPGSGGPPSYTWSAFPGIKLSLPPADPLSFTSAWVQ